MRRMEAFKCDVAGPIPIVPFAIFYICQALCDVGNGRWFDFEGLCVNEGRRQCTNEEDEKYHFGIKVGCIPFLQTSANESSTSEHMMARILRLVDRGRQ